MRVYFFERCAGGPKSKDFFGLPSSPFCLKRELMVAQKFFSLKMRKLFQTRSMYARFSTISL